MTKLKFVKSAILYSILTATLLFTACGKEAASTTSVSGSKGSSANTSDSKASASVSTSTEEPEPEITYTMTLCNMDSFGPLFQALVDGYNRLHPENGIELVQGFDYEAEEAGWIRLQNELATGEGPDFIITPSVKSLVNYGLLDYMQTIDDAVSPFIRNEIISGILESGIYEDKFYGLCPDIWYIKTTAVSSELYSENSWNIGDILRIMKEHPELERTFVVYDKTISYSTGETKNGLPVMISAAEYREPDTIQYIYLRNLSEYPYVDYNNMTTAFYCEEFVALLENIWRDHRSDIKSTDAGKTGRFLAEIITVATPAELITKLEQFYDGFSFPGIPTESGPGNEFKLRSFLTVTKAAKDKEAVKEFFDYVLSDEAQMTIANYGFPVKTGSARLFSDNDRIISLYESIMGNLAPNDYYSGIAGSAMRSEVTPYLDIDIDLNQIAENVQKTAQEKLTDYLKKGVK